MGKLIQLANDTTKLFTIAGIAQDAPANSSIQYEVLIPNIAAPDYEKNIKERFNNQTHIMIMELSKQADVSQFEIKMNKWVKTYFTDPFKAEYGKDSKFDFNSMHWHMRPIANSHYNISRPWGHYTNAKNIYQLACLAIIILFIASLNYILLAVSNAASRLQEVGVRKVMGANRKSIIVQFWVETQLIVIIAVLAGLFLSKIFLPQFSRLMDSSFGLDDFSGKERQAVRAHDRQWRQLL